MATEDQLIAGLKAADAAGNAEDAKHFADAIKAMRDQGSTHYLKNVAAGAGEALTGTLGMAGPVLDKALNIFNPLASVVDVASDIYQKKTGLPGFAPKSMAPTAEDYQALLGKVGLNPADVKANTLGEKLARGAGAGATAVLIPGVGWEGALANLATGTAAGLGSTLAGEMAPESLKPAAQLVGGLAGGYGALRGIGALRAAGTATEPAVALSVPEGTSQRTAQTAASYASKLASGANREPPQIAEFGAATPGKPRLGAEALGRPGVTALAAIGRRTGTTPDQLESYLVERAKATPDRILSDFAEASGINPNAARGNIDALIEANKKAAGPLYEQAYKANQNIASPAIDRILETPAGKRALSDARVKMQNDLSLMGTPDADLIAQAREGGTLIPQRGVASGMKLRVFDYIKQSMDDQINAAFRAGNKNEAGILVGLKNRLVRALDNADVTAAAGPNSLKPEGGLYKQARAKAGEYLSAENAFKEGGDTILNGNLPAKDFIQKFSNLGPADLEAFKGGIANKMYNLAQAGKLNLKTLQTPLMRQKLTAILGRDGAERFLQNLAVESEMAKFGSRMMPGSGSPTQEFAAAMGEQDSGITLEHVQHGLGIGADLIHGRPLSALTKAGVAAYRFGRAPVINTMPVATRNELGRILQLPPQELANYLEAYRTQAQRPSALETLGRQLPFGGGR